jgi:hypothetical protein
MSLQRIETYVDSLFFFMHYLLQATLHARQGQTNDHFFVLINGKKRKKGVGEDKNSYRDCCNFVSTKRIIRWQ